jgi:general stress protein 26
MIRSLLSRQRSIDMQHDEATQKLSKMLEGIDFCMLTSIDGGHLRSRPMSTQQAEFDGDIWFFTRDNTHKMEEIAAEPRVCCAYSKPDDSVYVSVSGKAELVRDRAKMEELWSPILKAWFPEGLEDPHICLLKVSAEQAEYWDSSSGKLVQLFGFVKALVTGQEADYGENKKLDLGAS